MLAVGVDVSKGKSMVAALTGDGKLVIRPKEFAHNESEMTALIMRLQSYGAEIRIVLEATGHYHFALVKRFQSAGLFVSVVNPFLMKKYLDGSIRKGKTDKKDAIKIATYCLEKWHKLTPYEAQDKQYEELRFLSRQYNQAVSTKVKGKVWLSQLLDQIMPGIKTVLKSNHRNPMRNVLYSRLTPKRVQALRVYLSQFEDDDAGGLCARQGGRRRNAKDRPQRLSCF